MALNPRVIAPDVPASAGDVPMRARLPNLSRCAKSPTYLVSHNQAPVRYTCRSRSDFSSNAAELGFDKAVLDPACCSIRYANRLPLTAREVQSRFQPEDMGGQMILQPVIRPATPRNLKVMVRKKRPSPTGGYIHTGFPVGTGFSGEVLFWYPEPKEGLTEVPLSLLIDIEEDSSEGKDEPDKDRVKRQGELPMEMVKTGTTGALAFAGVHAADKIGAHSLPR
jgi:hypothetical protein